MKGDDTMLKVFIDPGHGGTDSGATANGIVEKEVNLSIALFLREILVLNYENVQVKMSRDHDLFIPLYDRVKSANNWNADLYISIHCNASSIRTRRGYEDFVYTKSANSLELQDVLHGSITRTITIPDRGQKKANIFVLRETNMPAILTENGFISNAEDAKLLQDKTYLKMIARGHAQGIAAFFNLHPTVSEIMYYRVITGSFKTEKEALIRQQELLETGIETFILIEKRDENKEYSVVSGSFQSFQKAHEFVQELQEKEFKSFIVTVIVQ
jgi:N-acetylmuramoyl-L-alanine amidase